MRKVHSQILRRRLTGPEVAHLIADGLGHGWALGLWSFIRGDKAVPPEEVEASPGQFFVRDSVFLVEEAVRVYRKFYKGGFPETLTALLEAGREADPFWKAITDDLAVRWRPSVKGEDDEFLWFHASQNFRIATQIRWVPEVGTPWEGRITVNRPCGIAFLLHLSGRERSVEVTAFKGEVPAYEEHRMWASRMAYVLGANQLADLLWGLPDDPFRECHFPEEEEEELAEEGNQLEL